MIRLATNSDTDRLKRIWRVCFGDPEPYIDFFFHNAYEPEKTVVYEVEGQVCSMFFLLDSTVWIDGNEYQASYLYAAATLPEYRSRGFMGQMIQYAADFCRSIGKEFIVLVPAEQSLFGYYSRFGFQTYFYDAIETWTAANREQSPEPYELTREHIDSIGRIRGQKLKQNGGFMWNRVQLNYVLREHLFTGGGIFQTEDGYALYHLSDDVCKVDELIALPGKEARFKESFLAHLGASSFQIVHPCGEVGVPRARGMLLPLDTTERTVGFTGYPYIGLTLE